MSLTGVTLDGSASGSAGARWFSQRSGRSEQSMEARVGDVTEGLFHRFREPRLERDVQDRDGGFGEERGSQWIDASSDQTRAQDADEIVALLRVAFAQRRFSEDDVAPPADLLAVTVEAFDPDPT
jgi:hypothetical protein